MSKGLVPSDEQLAEAKRLKDEAGTSGTVGAIGGDIATQLIPGAAISKGMQVAGRAAPLLGEVAGSALLNTAFAPDAEKLEAAQTGALGGAAGSMLSKTLSGPMRGLMTKDSKLLSDAGITLPPGQMLAGTGSGPVKRAFTGAESSLSKIPVLGSPVKYRMSAAIEDYNKQQLNEILEPFGDKVTAGGREGIDQARDAMDKVFKEVTPNLYVPDRPAADLIDNFLAGVKAKDATVNDRTLKMIRDVMELELTPHVSKGDVEGEVAYGLGKKLDWYAKKFQGSPSPDHKSLNRAFKELRDEWYGLMEPKVGADPAYKDIIMELQKSKRRWMNMRDAADMTTEGFFTPAQVIKANKGYIPDDVTRAASHIMPKTAPEINVGSNALLHRMVTPGGVSGAAALGSYTGLGAVTPMLAPLAVATGAYTKPGLRYLERGATPLLSKLLRNKNLAPEQVENVTQQTISQLLRSNANAQSED
jgi:hypothetical protein